jgi:20S proteasome alpha/beta subunit
MTVIAWDGKSLAADRQADDGGIKANVTKIVRLPSGIILATSGTYWHMQYFIQWVSSGCIEEKWPDFQKDEKGFSELIVAEKGRVKLFDQGALPYFLEDPFFAWGSGAKFAMGAMAMGATAKEAVEITNRFSTSCGIGVDVFDIEPLAKLEAA